MSRRLVTVMVRGDEVPEPDETVVIALSGPTHATIAQGRDHGHGHGHHHRRRRFPSFDCGGRGGDPSMRVEPLNLYGYPGSTDRQPASDGGGGYRRHGDRRRPTTRVFRRR